MRDWGSIAPILDEVLELTGVERERALDRACTTDPELRKAVEELLAECHNDRGFLERPAAFFAASLVEETVVPDNFSLTNTRIGPYLLIKEIARGGMGTVWLGERADGQFQQQVALKLIKRGMDSDEIYRRFIAERQILARFNHSNIARLMDGGVTPEGQPWFAMEYVEGSSITRHAKQHGLSTDQRLVLFEHVCDAVRYAHQNLVVHRDLKPSNILVTEDGTVKLLDFGISKLLDDTSSEQSQVGTGLRAMTPEYAAPEQVRMEPITTATDIYALGAVLYELLTGRKAHVFGRRAPAEIERVICEVTPESPSIVADVDTIVLKALKKYPARRYATADALLDDIRRYRSGKPITARPDTLRYRTSKFLRRHVIGVSAGAGIVLSLIAGLAVATSQARVAQREALRAGREQEFLLNLFSNADPDKAPGRELSARDLLDKGVAQLDTALVSEPKTRAELFEVVGKTYVKLGLYPQADSVHRRSVELTGSVYGESHPLFAQRLRNWAVALANASQFRRSDSMLVEALGIEERKYGPRSIKLAETLRHLAAVKGMQAQFNESDGYFRRLISLRRSAPVVDSVELSLDLSDYCNILATAGRSAEAEKACNESLAIQRRHLKPVDPRYARTLMAAIEITIIRGKVHDAVALARSSLENRRQAHASSHPEVAAAVNTLANVLEVEGSYAESDSLFKLAYQMRRDLLGPDDAQTMQSLNGMAVLRLRLGDVAGAERLALQAIDGMSKARGPNHILTLMTRGNYATVLHEEGRYDEAEPIIRDVLAIRRRVLGETHPGVATSYRRLGLLLHKTGRLELAEQALRQANQTYRKTLPEHHFLIPETATELAAVLVDLKRPKEAEPFLREAMATELANLGPADLRLGETRRVLAEALMLEGRITEAKAMILECQRGLANNPYGARHRERARETFRRIAAAGA